MVTVRTLSPGDEAALEAFLVEHATSSMFLRANLRRRGLVYRGEPLAAGDLYVLHGVGPHPKPLACTPFNARLPDCVQVGGVFTPPDLRGRGHARAVVAGSLLDARAAGAARSILFTGTDNLPACRAYAALGYRVVGDYGIVLFAEPAPAPA